MSESRLRTLIDDAVAEVVLPDLGELAGRARKRRRRRRVAAGITVLTGAAAAVVVTVAPGSPSTTAPVEPVPTGPTSTTTRNTVSPPPSRRYLLRHPVALVNTPDAALVDVVYADPRHAAALWEGCSAADSSGTCPEVVTWTSDDWATSRAKVIPDKLSIYPLTDGSVVVWLYGGDSFIINPDGSTRSITKTDHPIPDSPGGGLVNLPSRHGGSPAGLLNVGTGTVYPPLSAPSTRCVYDDQWDTHETLWEDGAAHCGPAVATVAWTSDHGATWSTYAPGPGLFRGLAVTSARTGVYIGADTTGGRRTPGRVDVTADRGRHWHQIGLPPGLDGPSSTISTDAHGRLFLTDDAHTWITDAQWTAFHRTGSGPPTVDASLNGSVLCARNPASDDTIRCRPDGKHWQTVSPRP